MDIGRLILALSCLINRLSFSSLMDIGRLIRPLEAGGGCAGFSSLMDIGRLILNTSVLILMYVLVL